ITTFELLDFIRLASLLKRDIDLSQPARQDPNSPADAIPPSVATFLSGATGISVQDAMDLWVVLNKEVWLLDPEDNQSQLSALFPLWHALKFCIASLTVYPPTRTCTKPECPKIGTVLKRAEQHQVIVYSLADGARPAWSISQSCALDCQTNYHNNFSVHAGIRTYYGGIPALIQIGEHQFAEPQLVNMWISPMVLGWFSATNCAKSYDIALSDRTSLETGGWQFGLKLTPNHIWDVFVLKSLL
ncbi:hypothetical protein FB451DRAFT_997450, partial [Mycena latifolia]